MKKIAFTTGTLQPMGEFYTLVLMNGEKIVYKATVTTLDAAGYVNKYNNIKMIK